MIADTSFAVQGNKAAASEATEAADKDKSGVCCAVMFADKPVELNMRVFMSKNLCPLSCTTESDLWAPDNIMHFVQAWPDSSSMTSIVDL